jgi:hypothetical protein
MRHRTELFSKPKFCIRIVVNIRVEVLFPSENVFFFKPIYFEHQCVKTPAAPAPPKMMRNLAAPAPQHLQI